MAGRCVAAFGGNTLPRTSFFLLFGAIILAVVAVLIARFYITQPSAPVAQQVAAAPQTTAVVVAAAPIAFGDKITPDKMKLAQFPPASVPTGAFTSIAAVTAAGERTAMRTIEPNEPLLTKSLSGKGGRLSASGLIEPNMRAITVPVNDVSGVAGFLASGDRVDVFLTRSVKATTAPFAEQQFTDVLMQNIRVLAVGQDADEAKSKPEIVRTATLALTPMQAQKMILAQTAGSLSLMLRGIADAAQTPLRTVRLTDLHDGNSEVVRIRTTRTVRRGPPRFAGDTVEIIRNGKSEKYTVPVSG